MDFGTRLRSLRKKHNHTLKDLAQRVNFNYSNLSKIERGERKASLELLENIANVYDVSVSYLIGEDYTKDEKDFIHDSKKLTIDELIDKYEIVVGDRTATKEEIQEAVKYIMIKRQMNN